MVAYLAEFEKGIEDGDVASSCSFGLDRFADFLFHGDADGFVEFGLLTPEADSLDDLSFAGKFTGDLLFGTAEDEGGRLFC